MGITHPDSLLELMPPLAKERVGIDKATESKSKIVSNKTYNMSSSGVVLSGGVKPRKKLVVRFGGLKPTYVEILSHTAKNEPD